MRRILGMISGTSHDGIDVATMEFEMAAGVLEGRLVHVGSQPYDPDLRRLLIESLPPAQASLARFCELDTRIGQAFADAAAAAIAAGGAVDAICSHGQTVYHWVEDNRALGTLQIGQPAWIAERTGVPVVADIRARDLTVGGQGAPLASLIDYLVLNGRPGVSAALNLGGISNMTVVAEDRLAGWDIGPANALLDAVVVARGLNALGYDADAQIAGRGQVDQELLSGLLAEPYYRLAPPKTTGKELFHLAYVEQALAALGREVSDSDLMATLVELTARTIADAVHGAGVTYLVASGGGCHNPVLMDRLRRLLPEVEIVLADAIGLPADGKEAVLMALMGWCTMHGLPGVTPGGTGSKVARIMGSITPGWEPLRLPEPVPELTSLRLIAAQA